MAELAQLHVPAAQASLLPGWTWRRLDCVTEAVIDCPHSTPSLTESGPYVVRSQDIRTGVFRADGAAHVSEETYRDRVQRAEPSPGDLVYSREGTYFGIAAEVPAKTRLCLGQRMVLIRPNPRKMHYRFLRYWLNSPTLASHLGGFRDGSVAERFNLPTIRALPVSVPPLPVQRSIARILGALDDKIELNRKMNETLEQMARAIFKSWFVDFEPFRDKGMVDSPLGRAPRGWKVTKLGDMVELAYGKALKDEVRKFGAFPVYGSNGQVGWHNEPLVKGPGIVVGRKGNPGTVTWVPSDFFPIDTTFFVVPKGDCRSLFYLFHALRSQGLESFGADSAVPGLNRNVAYMNNMLLPSSDALERFDVVVSPMASSVSANDSQSSTLAAIRDALLPKLMSGEVGT